MEGKRRLSISRKGAVARLQTVVGLPNSAQASTLIYLLFLLAREKRGSRIRSRKTDAFDIVQRGDLRISRRSAWAHDDLRSIRSHVSDGVA